MMVERSDRRQKNFPIDFRRSRAKSLQSAVEFVFGCSVSRSIENQSSPIRSEGRKLRPSPKFFFDQTVRVGGRVHSYQPISSVSTRTAIGSGQVQTRVRLELESYTNGYSTFRPGFYHVTSGFKNTSNILIVKVKVIQTNN